MSVTLCAYPHPGIGARIPSAQVLSPSCLSISLHTRCILICLAPNYTIDMYTTQAHTHSLPPYHFTEEPSPRRSNHRRAIICLPPTIRRSNLTAGRHLGGGGPTRENICQGPSQCVQMPLPYYGKSVCAAHRSLSFLGEIGVCEEILGPPCTAAY